MMTSSIANVNDAFKKAEEAFRENTIIHVRVYGYNEQGLKMGVFGLRGLLPFVRFNPERRKRLEACSQDQALSRMVGEQISIYIYKIDKKHGFAYLSEPDYSPERFVIEPVRKAWEKAELFMNEKKVVSSSIVGCSRHGLVVPFENLRGFLPYALFSESRKRECFDKGVIGNYQFMVGQSIAFMIVKVNQKKVRLTFSERAAERQKLFGSIPIGTILDGRVVRVTDFGVFVDLGGVVSLIHISEIGTISECGFSMKTVKKGQFVKARLVSIDMEKRRGTLSGKFS
jgi:ribosomal protein S1